MPAPLEPTPISASEPLDLASVRKAAQLLIASFGLDEALQRARHLERGSIVPTFARGVRLEVERRAAQPQREVPPPSPTP